MNAPRALLNPPAPVRVVQREARPTFAEVYEAHFSFVWRSARRLGVLQANADDVTQEIFVVVHRRLTEFEGRSSIKTWLSGIILNVVRAHRRHMLAKHPHSITPGDSADLDAVTDTAEGPHEIASRAEAASLLEDLLAVLDDDKREVFVLAELEEMGAPEIALAIGVPVNTVYSRLRIARQEFAAATARHRARDDWRMR
jgi:RNA polymerase sigma-70 factor (ECF subfamily)